MTPSQKIAALVFRIASVAMLFYSIFVGIFAVLAMGVASWGIALIPLTMGVALFVFAVPLSKLVTLGFND